MASNEKKRVALVTGATGGLGTAMCKRLYNDGYFVVANYRNPKKAELWKEKMAAEGYNFEMVQGDVADYASVENMVKEGTNSDQSFIPVDIDKINLLLDTLKTRIGACSR